MSAIEATARGSGPYVVYVDGSEYSRHTAEREALENATEALAANPGAAVHYVHDYVVDVTLVDAVDAEPEPEPEPEPAPELDPVEGELLHIDWSTALGNSVEAVGDGGKGIMRWCQWPDVLEVVDVDGVRALGIRSIQNCGHVEFPDLFPTPAAGQVWGLSYLAMNEAGQSDTKMHPHCFWPVGAIEAVHLSIGAWHHEIALSGGQWLPGLGFAWGSDSAFPFGVIAYRDGAPWVVEPGEWIDYSFEKHWVSDTQYFVRAEIRNLAGDLVTDDFRGTDWPQVQMTDEHLCTIQSPENVRTPSFGMGQAGSSGARYFVADARFWLR